MNLSLEYSDRFLHRKTYLIELFVMGSTNQRTVLRMILQILIMSKFKNLPFLSF